MNYAHQKIASLESQFAANYIKPNYGEVGYSAIGSNSSIPHEVSLDIQEAKKALDLASKMDASNPLLKHQLDRANKHIGNIESGLEARKSQNQRLLQNRAKLEQENIANAKKEQTRGKLKSDISTVSKYIFNMNQNDDIFGNQKFAFHDYWIINAGNPTVRSEFQTNTDILLGKLEEFEKVVKYTSEVFNIALKIQDAHTKSGLLTPNQLERCNNLRSRNIVWR